MHVTVAICTWNRAKLLDRTLAGMRNLIIPSGVYWELLVVNNNSTDDTDEVIARHVQHLPILRLFEPEPGHSVARNRAVAAAGGDLILWTDDDVLVEPNWLLEYVKAARSWPGAGFFGGAIEPWFETDPPRWLHQSLHRIGPVYAIRSLGQEVRPLADGELPFGANMAFWRADLARNPFDKQFGHRSGDLGGGDETDVFHRLKGQGRHGVWVGPARVRHFIPSERMTASYLWRWYRGHGRAFARQNNLIDSGKTLCGAPRWAVRKYFESRFRSWALRLLRRDWVDSFTRSAFLLGIIEGTRSVGAAMTPRAAEYCKTSPGDIEHESQHHPAYVQPGRVPGRSPRFD